MPMPSYGLGGGEFQIVNHLGVLVFAKFWLQPFFLVAGQPFYIWHSRVRLGGGGGGGGKKKKKKNAPKKKKKKF